MTTAIVGVGNIGSTVAQHLVAGGSITVVTSGLLSVVECHAGMSRLA